MVAVAVISPNGNQVAELVAVVVDFHPDKRLLDVAPIDYTG